MPFEKITKFERYKTKIPTQYNKIAEQYKGYIPESITRKYSFIPTFLYFLGNAKDKTILDLACGEGFYSRIAKKEGASKIVGVDISENMIELAKQEEKERPLGIDYLVHDVKDLPEINKFDLVIAVFLLHYAKTKEELLTMCKNIYKNLKKDGSFLTINSNPLNPLQLNKKYDFTISAEEPLKEGDTFTVTLFADGEKSCSFQGHFWKKETYENALKEAGFREIAWHKMIVSQEGIERFGQDFWKEYLEHPSHCVIKCVK
jgi:2-polyprenyl-3-methyl-5-hydroxy-6-metoxy-1,4-benzoquinol methylase